MIATGIASRSPFQSTPRVKAVATLDPSATRLPGMRIIHEEGDSPGFGASDSSTCLAARRASSNDPTIRSAGIAPKMSRLFRVAATSSLRPVTMHCVFDLAAISRSCPITMAALSSM